jgi:hypothetical protein
VATASQVARETVALRQLEPGRYEGAVSADATEILTLTVAGAETGSRRD